MRPVARTLIKRIENFRGADPAARRVARAVSRVVPHNSQTKDLLSGTWLGHPLHPPMTDVVVGSWTAAVVLDVLPGTRCQPASDRLVGLGLLAALPTVATGATDFADLSGKTRRVGLVHAAGNTTAAVLFACSYVARKSGRHLPGSALSATGLAAAAASAYLGGHLSFDQGVGVNRATSDSPPQRWTPVMEASDLEERKLTLATAAGTSLLLYRHDDTIDALVDRCTHLGCGLHGGTVSRDRSVTCPCHGSTFRLTDGAVLKGPARAPQPALETRIRDGLIEVRRAAS